MSDFEPPTMDVTKNIEERRLDLEREKFENELKRQKKEDSSIVKHGTAFITVAVGLLATVISIAQFFLQRDKAEIDRALENIKNEREWKLQAVKIVMDNDKKLFSQQASERATAISIIKTALPIELYNNILGLVAGQSQSNEAKEQFRSAQVLNLSHPLAPSAATSTTSSSPKNESTLVSANISFKVSATPVAEKSKSYNFTIEIKAGNDVKKLIDRIDYVINHPSFKVKKYSSSSPDSNFSMTYYGWGAVDEVDATIRFKDGTVKETNINMIQELGW